MLVLDSVHAAYGHSETLHGVSLAVEKGQVVCIVGRNGAGKTSTMRCVVHDMIRVTGGEIRFDGESLSGLPPHTVIRKGIGYVPEDRRVFASLSVLENLKVPRPAAPAARHEWTIAKVFELFPLLEQFRTRLAGNLSGGMQQMLTIGRSLLTNPRLLLLDEPHEGLAPLVAQEVERAIGELKAAGVALLISEQQISLVNELADRIYVIDKGVTVFGGTLEEFDRDPDLARKYLMLVQQPAAAGPA